MQKDCWYNSVSAQFRDVIDDYIYDMTWFLNAKSSLHRAAFKGVSLDVMPYATLWI